MPFPKARMRKSASLAPPAICTVVTASSSCSFDVHVMVKTPPQLF